MTLLPWHSLYDWQWMFHFLGARTVQGIETFVGDSYCRSFALNGHAGLITVTPDDAAQGMRVTLSAGLQPVAEACLARVARLFDLSCDPQQIALTLGSLALPRPGLRLPGSLDAFEQAVRAVLGQLVSVAMAAKLTGKVVAAFGEPLTDAPGFYLFPSAQRLGRAAPLASHALGLLLRRASGLITLGGAATR
ncbi:DNA-3-methyladenine glycosylase 2, partial [Klebsiella michiganensis]|uniref:DNA-3-methyladenine glycosylase 2 n=1 Tax=Klebsiella michiganensis TaxID=1134687 RepID=UPI001E585CBB